MIDARIADENIIHLENFAPAQIGSDDVLADIEVTGGSAPCVDQQHLRIWQFHYRRVALANVEMRHPNLFAVVPFTPPARPVNCEGHQSDGQRYF